MVLAALSNVAIPRTIPQLISQSPALGPAFPHSIFSLYPPSMCVLPVVPTAFRYAQPLSSEPPLPSAQGYSHGVGLCSAKASTGWPGPHLSAGISAVPRPAWASSVCGVSESPAHSPLSSPDLHSHKKQVRNCLCSTICWIYGL